jgi:hypothetical protein
MSLPPQESAGQRAEDAAAARLLTREAAEEPVEEERALVTIEVTVLVAGGRLEQLGWNEIEARSGRGGRKRHGQPGEY